VDNQQSCRVGRLLLIAVVFLGGCLPRCAPLDDAEASAALRDVLQQYQKRGELAKDLIVLVHPPGHSSDTPNAEVAAAQASLDRMVATRQARPDQIEFERFKVAQRQLGDAISRLLIESGNDRRLRQDSRFRSLRRQLAAADRRIATAQKAYDEAADRYNAKRTFWRCMRCLSSMCSTEPRSGRRAPISVRCAARCKFEKGSVHCGRRRASVVELD
jgi:LemA protein